MGASSIPPVDIVTPEPPLLGTWARQAACTSAEPQIFFSAAASSKTLAKSVCAICTVRAECLEYALAASEDSGIWGGLDEAERRSLRRKRQRRVSHERKTA